MAYIGETTLKNPLLDGSVDVRVSARNNAPHHEKVFGTVATVVLSAGYASIQCYATRPQLTELAEILLAAGEALAQAEREQIAAAA